MIDAQRAPICKIRTNNTLSGERVEIDVMNMPLEPTCGLTNVFNHEAKGTSRPQLCSSMMPFPSMLTS